MGLLGPSLYLLLLIFGCLATPGTGIAGSVLAVFPQPVADYSHAPAYALLTWLLTNGLQTRGWSRQSALQASVVAAMVFGVGMEFLQVYVPGRTVDIHDVAYNAVGIAAAAFLIGPAPDIQAYALLPGFLRSRK